MMRLTLKFFLIIFLISNPFQIRAGNSIQEEVLNTEAIWQTGIGAHDGAYTAIASSMLGWGVGLSLLIAILSMVIHQSVADNAHAH